MSSYLGHPSFTLRRVTGTLPARARQLPNAKFSPKLFSDDVLIISSDDHWYLVSPLDIEPTRPKQAFLPLLEHLHLVLLFAAKETHSNRPPNDDA